MLPNIHIIGIQGSGKGTQSALLVEKFRFTYLAAGNMFRERAAVGDDIGQSIAASMQAGKLLPIEFLVLTIDGYLHNHPVTTGVLGDGIMRTIEQYYELERIWKDNQVDEPYLINLVLDEATALQRIDNRRQEQEDPNRKAHHELYSGKLLKRNDDNPLAIHERFAIFHSLTEPVVSLFKEQRRCIDVDASLTIPEVERAVTNAVTTWYPHLSTYVSA